MLKKPALLGKKASATKTGSIRNHDVSIIINDNLKLMSEYGEKENLARAVLTNPYVLC